MHYSLAPCPARIPDSVRVVIALTTSKEVVYDLPASRERLVIDAGAFKPEMAEIGAATLRDSLLFVDDPGGARHEAGILSVPMSIGSACCHSRQPSRIHHRATLSS